MKTYPELFAVKPEYRNAVVGFNNSGKPLAQRTDLDKLALMAYHNRGLGKYFVSLPSLEEIKEYQAAQFNAANPVPTVTEPQSTTTPAPVTSNTEATNE